MSTKLKSFSSTRKIKDMYIGDLHKQDDILFSKFYGGIRDGRCVQMTLEGEYVQFNKTDLDNFIQHLIKIREKLN